MNPQDTTSLRELLRVVVKSLGVLERYQNECCSITIPQCSALLEIGLAGEISLVELSSRLALDKSTISRTVDSLVNVGAVCRCVDPENRRYVRLSLTDEGMGIYKQLDASYMLFLESVLASLPQDKRDQVLDSISLLTQAFVITPCCKV